MKVIYIAGPYRAANEFGVYKNIENARMEALFVWRVGGVALCPHGNTAFFGGACPDDVWLRGDIELLKRCDAIYAIQGWEASSGTRAEVDYAGRSMMPCLFSRDEVLKYLSAANESRHPEPTD